MLFFLRVLRFLPLLLFLLMVLKILSGVLRQAGSGRFHQGSGGGKNQRREHAGTSGKPSEPYEILGCKRSDSNDVIRKRYRELVAKYHPDKFIGQNLDKEFIELASRKFQRIQEAYERIRRERNMH
ncbi:MAG: J domain-containing protein [Thermovirgaceae bacterium]